MRVNSLLLALCALECIFWLGACDAGSLGDRYVSTLATTADSEDAAEAARVQCEGQVPFVDHIKQMLWSQQDGRPGKQALLF